MNWTAFGLGLDIVGLLMLAASTVGWRRAEGIQTIHSWLTEGPPRRWLERWGRDPEHLRVFLFRSGWLAILTGFVLQFAVSVGWL